MYFRLVTFSCAVGALVLGGLTGCGGSSTKKTPQPTALVTQNDSYTQQWQAKIELDVMANDQVSDFVRLELVDKPTLGTIEIDGRTLTYIAPEQELTDNFTYRVVTATSSSSATNVSIDLTNGLTSVALENESLVEGKTYELALETALPLNESKIDILLSRNGNQAEKIAEISGDSSSLNWTYVPTGESDGKSYLSPDADELIFRLAGSEASLNYLYWRTPEPNELYNTIRTIWASDAQADRIVKERQFLLNWTSFPAWTIPDQPNWTEDPFNNNTWLLYYHSLAWLQAYEQYYLKTGEQHYRDEIKRTIFDYLAASPRDNKVNYMSWNDHTVAIRIDMISYFYQKFLKYELDQDEQRWFENKMQEHAAELRYLLDLDIYYAHNHSIFHSVSLLNLVLILPDVFADTDYAAAAEERIETLFTTMVVPETGFSREQATGYHFVAMELFISASQFLQRIHKSDTTTTKQGLNLMTDAAAHLIYRDGGAPAMGDTNYGVKPFRARLQRIVNTGGLESSYYNGLFNLPDASPLKRAYHEQTEGIVILRPNSGVAETVEQYALVDFGLPKISHGHHDATHVTYAVNGNEVLVDAGGPFLYQGRERVYFDTKLSHNVPIVNGQIRVTNAAETFFAECQESACYTFGGLTESGYQHRRLVVAPTGNDVNLYIFDIVETTDPASNDEIQLNWHFAPKVSQPQCSSGIDLIQTCALTHAELGNFTMTTQTNTATIRTLYVGYDDGSKQQGWVQPKFGSRAAAPTLNYQADSGRFVMLTALTPGPTTAAFEPLSNGYKLHIDDHEVVITAPMSNAPLVEVRPLNGL